MMKMREEMRKLKNKRIKSMTRTILENEFDEIEVREIRRAESSRRLDKGVLRSDEVDRRMVQDKGNRVQVVGADVEQLYPSLHAVEVAEIVYKAMLDTEVKFDNMEWLEACKYIALTSTAQECRLGPLKRILPIRRKVNGVRPGITGEDPLSKDSGCQEQWEFKDLGSNGLTGREKKLVLAKVMKTAVLAIFKTHTYSFGAKYYLQSKGGPIGLRSTCCVARLIMCWWDDRLVEVMEKAGMEMLDGARYMDDIRIWCHAIRLGWRLVDGVLMFSSKWRQEEREERITPLQKTTKILEELMNSICGWLVLTMETEDMFKGKLPTLDLEIWVDKDNMFMYHYYEKPMIPDTVLHRRSAMPEGTRRATLNQELIRRMVNTSELVPMNTRLEIIDKYAGKLLNSEYPLDQTRNIIIGGLKGYERLLSLSRDVGNPKWKPLHLSAGWNSRNRRIAKLRSKDNWYKGKVEVEPPGASEMGQKSSIHQEGDQSGQAGSSSRREGPAKNIPHPKPQGVGSRLDTTPPVVPGPSASQDQGYKKDGKWNPNKKRGTGRPVLTLGGKNKVEKARRIDLRVER